MGRDKRKEVAKEIKKTHFELGHDRGGERSTAQDNFGQHQVMFDMEQQKKLRNENRKSNFVFSNEPGHQYAETTNTRDYNEKRVGSDAAVETKNAV